MKVIPIKMEIVSFVLIVPIISMALNVKRVMTIVLAVRHRRGIVMLVHQILKLLMANVNVLLAIIIRIIWVLVFKLL